MDDGSDSLEEDGVDTGVDDDASEAAGTEDAEAEVPGTPDAAGASPAEASASEPVAEAASEPSAVAEAASEPVAEAASEPSAAAEATLAPDDFDVPEPQSGHVPEISTPPIDPSSLPPKAAGDAVFTKDDEGSNAAGDRPVEPAQKMAEAEDWFVATGEPAPDRFVSDEVDRPPTLPPVAAGPPMIVWLGLLTVLGVGLFFTLLLVVIIGLMG